MWLTADEIEALALSLSVASRSVLLSLPFAVLLAWVLTRRQFVGRTVLDAFVHLPLVHERAGRSAAGSNVRSASNSFLPATAPRWPPR